jgi:hypothetical protein
METNEQQHLRILESGPRGPEDYEVVKYLKEKGYTKSGLDFSRRPDDTFGKVTSVIWTGPTASGFDYIDLLTAEANKPKEFQKINADDRPDESAKAKQWYEKPIGIIGLGIIVTVLGVLAVYAIKIHLGIPI